MNKSETIGELAKALAKAQGEMSSAKKSADNPFFKSKYADLHEVMDSIRKPLTDNGLAISQLIQPDPDCAVVETILMHESGEWLSSIIQIKPTKNDAQGMGSAITYARRYSASSIVGLASEEDDDGNEASKTNGTQKAESQPSSQGNGKEHYCTTHNCKFYKNEKNGEIWYSHKIAGSNPTKYCNEPKEVPETDENIVLQDIELTAFTLCQDKGFDDFNAELRKFLGRAPHKEPEGYRSDLELFIKAYSDKPDLPIFENAQ